MLLVGWGIKCVSCQLQMTSWSNISNLYRSNSADIGFSYWVYMLLNWKNEESMKVSGRKLNCFIVWFVWFCSFGMEFDERRLMEVLHPTGPVFFKKRKKHISSTLLVLVFLKKGKNIGSTPLVFQTSRVLVLMLCQN